MIQRPRPELDPLGMHVGDYFWFSRAELDEAYNSNIFATSRATTSDLITVLAPAFDLLSSFGRMPSTFVPALYPSFMRPIPPKTPRMASPR